MLYPKCIKCIGERQVSRNKSCSDAQEGDRQTSSMHKPKPTAKRSEPPSQVKCKSDYVFIRKGKDNSRHKDCAADMRMEQDQAK